MNRGGSGCGVCSEVTCVNREHVICEYANGAHVICAYADGAYVNREFVNREFVKPRVRDL